VSEEPLMDVAHLGHLELLTPKPEKSLRFFVEVMGMTESGRKGDSVYLRAYDDYERHSLQLTAPTPQGLVMRPFGRAARRRFNAA
jgi:catechol 2,3-dioxygenase